MFMKRIKHISLIIMLVVGSGFLNTSCDKMDGRYLTPFKQSEWTGRRVLLEDYTGQKCPNCPAGAKIAKDLKDLYGEKLIVVSIHAGWFAKPDNNPPFNTDYRTVAGTEYDDYFGIGLVGNPNGMVNRTGWKGSHILSPNAWTSKIVSEMNKAPQVEVEIAKDYTAATRNLSIDVKTTFKTTLQKNLKLLVWITEDSIVSPQQNNDPNIGTVGVIQDYVHRHMLRGTANSTWGTLIANTSVAVPKGTVKNNNFTYTLPANWKDSNCYIVAFVYDDQNKEVFQANELKIK